MLFLALRDFDLTVNNIGFADFIIFICYRFVVDFQPALFNQPTRLALAFNKTDLQKCVQNTDPRIEISLSNRQFTT